MNGFRALVGGELLKIRRQPANWPLPLFMLAQVFLTALLSSGDNRPVGDQDSVVRAVLDPLTLTLQVGVGLPLLVLAVLVVGQEYQLGTVRVLIGRGTGRVRLLLAKLTALAIVAATGAVVTGAAAAGALWLVEPEPVRTALALGGPIARDAGLNLVAVVLSLAACILLGVFVASVGRSVAFGLALALIWFPIENVGLLVLPALTVLTRQGLWDGLTLYLLGGNLNTMVQALEPGRRTVVFLAAPEPQVDGKHAVLVVLAYLAVFLATSLGLSWRRDVHA